MSKEDTNSRETVAATPPGVVDHINEATDIDQLRRMAIGWLETAAMHARNEDYYRGLLDACAPHLGPAVYTQDDGGIVTEPLRAKVPECVAVLAAARAESAERTAALEAEVEAAREAESAEARSVDQRVTAARADGVREGRAMFVSALVSQLRTDVEECGGRYTTIGAVIWMLADAIERGDCPPPAASPVAGPGVADAVIATPAFLLPPFPPAVVNVLAERQVQREQWGDEHDDEHDDGMIRLAAASLACDGTDGRVLHPDGEEGENFDPWGLVARHGHCGAKPDKRRAVVIAAALLIAEIERLDRAALARVGGGGS